MPSFLLNLNTGAQLITIYLTIINLISFFYFGYDKMMARLDKKRISEKMLWILTLIGGSVGALLGMRYFRHKTKKLSFQMAIAIIIAVQVFVVVEILNRIQG